MAYGVSEKEKSLKEWEFNLKHKQENELWDEDRKRPKKIKEYLNKNKKIIIPDIQSAGYQNKKYFYLKSYVYKVYEFSEFPNWDWKKMKDDFDALIDIYDRQFR